MIYGDPALVISMGAHDIVSVRNLAIMGNVFGIIFCIYAKRKSAAPHPQMERICLPWDQSRLQLLFDDQ